MIVTSCCFFIWKTKINLFFLLKLEKLDWWTNLINLSNIPCRSPKNEPVPCGNLTDCQSIKPIYPISIIFMNEGIHLYMLLLFCSINGVENDGRWQVGHVPRLLAMTHDTNLTTIKDIKHRVTALVTRYTPTPTPTNLTIILYICVCAYVYI